MAPRKPPVWRIESPAFRCPHCKKPVRAVYYGRWQFWGLKGGRGWRQQDPDRDPVAPPEPRVTPREPLDYSPGPAEFWWDHRRPARENPPLSRAKPFPHRVSRQ